METLIPLLFSLVLLGFFCYIICLIPMKAPFPTIITAVFALIAVIMVFQALGFKTGLNHLGF